jgi:hypothetical protein
MPTPPQLPWCEPSRPLSASIIPAAPAAGDLATAPNPLTKSLLPESWRDVNSFWFQTELLRFDRICEPPPGPWSLPPAAI